MSWRAVAYVKSLRTGPNGQPLTRSEKFLLLVLADYYRDDQQVAWPSVRRLANDALLCERQTRYLLRSLEHKALLVCESRIGPDRAPDSNRYRLPGLEGGTLAEGVGQGLPHPVQREPAVKGVGQSSGGDGATISTGDGATIPAPKRLTEPPIEPPILEEEEAAPTTLASVAPIPASGLPEGVTAMLDILARYTGLDALPEFSRVLARRYGHLDLEEEAIRIVSWLRKRRQDCTEGFVLDWLRRERAVTPLPLPVALAQDAAVHTEMASVLPFLPTEQCTEQESSAASGAEQVWGVVRPALQGRLKRSEWETWLEGARAVSLEGEELVVGLPTAVAVEWVERKWGGLAEEAATGALGRALRVQWVTRQEHAM